MAREEDGRGGPESSKGDFDGRDLLAGRPEGAKVRPTAEPPQLSPAPPPPASPPPDPHDDAIREILETVRATAARVDSIQDGPGAENQTAQALTRETAALTQAVTDARGALAKAAELAARRDGAAEAARSLAGTAAALKTQGEALDQRIHATDRQSAVAAHTSLQVSESRRPGAPLPVRPSHPEPSPDGADGGAQMSCQSIRFA